MKLG
jgi:hypothetical protein